ncbi:MAG: DUF6724 family protein [Raoultibacter sp.]|jgi:uncharacterized membrane-anchored protein YhcB (DUF1043 family)
MDIGALYYFLFETYAGVAVLVGIGIVIGLIACVIMERRTRKLYKNHEQTEDDWSFFDDETEDSEKN